MRLVRAVFTVTIAVAFLVGTDAVAMVREATDSAMRTSEISIVACIRAVFMLVATIGAISLAIAEETHRETQITSAGVGSVDTPELVGFALALHLVGMIRAVRKAVTLLSRIGTFHTKKTIHRIVALAAKPTVGTRRTVLFVYPSDAVHVPVADLVLCYAIIANVLQSQNPSRT
jgi:hypothetical protein